MAQQTEGGMILCDASSTINCSQSPECAARMLYDTTSVVMSLAVMPSILALGLVGNLAFLFVIARVPSMRTVTNAYLTNLAVSDVLFLVFSVGDKVYRYLVTPFPGDQIPLGPVGCTGLYLLQHLFNWVSIFLVTLVSFERYCGLCHPLKHMVLHSFSRTWKLIAGAWLIALVLSLALVPGHYRILYLCIVWPYGDPEYSQLADLIGLCAAAPGHDWLGTISNLIQTIPFFFAMVLSCFAYTRIICALRHRSEEIELSKEAIVKNNRVRNQVSVMLITNGVAFFVCVGPFQVYTLFAALRDLFEKMPFDSFGQVYVHTARIMLYLNSAVNPYIYNLTNATYRQSFREAFTGVRVRGPGGMSRGSSRRKMTTGKQNLAVGASAAPYKQNGDGQNNHLTT